MADFVIEAEPRTVVGKKVRFLRREGLVPINVYGPKIDSVNLQVPYRALELALMGAGGTNLIEIKSNGDSYTVLARDVQREVLLRTILHVDFFALDLNTPIRAEIPIELVGESPAVTARVGILISGPNALTIEVLPHKLMNVVEVDVSTLVELGDGIFVRDLELGDDVLIHNDPGQMLARIVQTSADRADEDLEDEEGEELGDEDETYSAEVEVITKGKGEEDEE